MPGESQAPGKPPFDRERRVTIGTVLSALDDLQSRQAATIVEQTAGIRETLAQIGQALAVLQQGLSSHDSGQRIAAILQDRSERLETNVATLQQTTNLVMDRVSEPRTRETEILASVVTTVFDMQETLDTVREALVGLTNQMALDKATGGCAWRSYLATRDADEQDTLFDNLDRISKLAEKLETIVGDDLREKGYNPTTGEKREWVNIQIDRVRDGIRNSLINAISLSVILAFIWLYKYVVGQGQVTRMRQELAAKVQTYEGEKAQNVQELAQLREENHRLKHQPR